MKRKRFLLVLIASVWLINGLLCKILNLVPRHRSIVERILGAEQGWLVYPIGALELCIVLWIVSGRFSKLCGTVQIIAVLSMNILESIFAKDLLLFGAWNLPLSIMFCGIIAFVFYKR